jgi:hypothetical protein
MLKYVETSAAQSLLEIKDFILLPGGGPSRLPKLSNAKSCQTQKAMEVNPWLAQIYWIRTAPTWRA